MKCINKRDLINKLLFILISSTIQSQNAVVINSLNHNPIPFVNIQIGRNSGTYSNENGAFEFNKQSKDTLRFSHISYNDYQIKVCDIKDTIVLSPNDILLKEVKITNGKEITKYVDFPKRNSNQGSFPVQSKSEILALIIPDIKNENAIITKLDFKFEKERFDNSKTKTALRINVYDTEGEYIKNKIFSTEAYIIDISKKDRIEVDLSQEFITLSKKGLFIGLEVIGNIDDQGEITKEKAYIRPILSGNIINDYSLKTFLKYTFDKLLILKPINGILEEATGEKLSRNLSFGLTIIKQ